MEIVSFFLTPYEKAAVVAQDIVQWLDDRGVQYRLPLELAQLMGREESGRTANELTRDADLLLSLGGDGTFLRAARLANNDNIPLMGINLGTLGFLTEVSVAEWQDALTNVFAGNFQIEERMMLSCSVTRSGEKVFSGTALNDVVLHRGASSHLLHLGIHINGRFIGSYSADGLVVSTPTGSTAYSLSCGGPLVHSGVECIIITAIAPHTLSARPLVISSRESVMLKEAVSSMKGLSLDGQENFILGGDDEVHVERASSSVKFIKVKSDFYQIVRQKLKWVEE